MDKNSRKTTYATLFIGLLCASSNLHASESSAVSNTIAETTKEYLSDPARTGSLVGTIIAGSAVANPLAPVLGSVVGFVIGKSSAFTQKSDSVGSQKAYSKRSLMPADGTEITSLSLQSGTSTLTSSDTSTLATVPVDDATVTTLTGSATAFNIPEVPELAAAQPSMNNDRLKEVVIVEDVKQSRIATTIETIVPTDLVQEAQMGIPAIQLTNSGLAMEMAGSSDLQKRLAEACSNYRIVKTASLNCYYNTQ